MRAVGYKLVVLWTWASSLLLVGAVCFLLGFLLFKGAPVINLRLIFGQADPWSALLLRVPVFDGLLPAMAGSVLLVLMAVGLALPVGLGAGVYLAEYSRGRVKRVLSLLFDILAGIPSIVVGLAGFSLAVFLHHHLDSRIYPCLLISALALAFLVLPYLIRSTQAALESIPLKDRLTATSLGAGKFQNIRRVLVPRSLDGIVSGVILAVGRCAEDTAVIMLTGAVATAGIPDSVLSTYEALPFYIYYICSAYMDQQELMNGYGAAIVLMVLCGMLFAASFAIKNRLAGRFHGRV